MISVVCINNQCTLVSQSVYIDINSVQWYQVNVQSLYTSINNLCTQVSTVYIGINSQYILISTVYNGMKSMYNHCTLVSTISVHRYQQSVYSSKTNHFTLRIKSVYNGINRVHRYQQLVRWYQHQCICIHWYQK